MEPRPAADAPSLDVQVLEGLEDYIATEQFLHTLEAASAEWIDLAERREQHAAARPSAAAPPEPAAAAAAAAAQPDPGAAAAPQQPPPPPQQQQPSRGGGGLFRRFSRGSSSGGAAPAAAADSGASCSGTQAPPGSSAAKAAAGAGGFEVLEQQPPLHDDAAQHEPFVLVSQEDAVEGMAYYIALYLSRAPEARNMDPKALQDALRRTMTAVRRSRYRVLWEWGRWLYRAGAVSYSALQLYEHPWLVRALVAGVWASGKMAIAVLV